MGFAPPPILDDALAQLPELSPIARVRARRRFDGLSAELGVFAGFETALELCAAVSGDEHLACMDRPQTLCVLADNGIARRWPRAGKPTLDILHALMNGSSPASQIAQSVGARLTLADAGIAARVQPKSSREDITFTSLKLRRGTGDISRNMAMSEDDAEDLLLAGIKLAQSLPEQSLVIMAGGGRASEVSSATLNAALNGEHEDIEIPRRPEGFDDIALGDARRLILAALVQHQTGLGDPIGILSSVGGFEHAVLAGAIIGCAIRRSPMMIDGYAAAASAAWLVSFCPHIAAFLIPADSSLPAPWLRVGLAPAVHSAGVSGCEGLAGMLAASSLQHVLRVYRQVSVEDAEPGGFEVDLGSVERKDGQKVAE